MTRRQSYIVPGLLALALSACGPYSVSVNEKTVYNPPPLFSDYRTADRALHACIQQTIADHFVRRAAQLTQLNCSSAGVESLDGIAVFNQLKAINLANNELKDATPLVELKALETVKLTGNSALSCEAVHTLRASGVRVIGPESCPPHGD